MPVRRFTEEGLVQCGLSYAVISLDVDDIHPDIPFPEWTIIETRIKTCDPCAARNTGSARQTGDPMLTPVPHPSPSTETPLVMPAEAQRDQQEMQNFEGWEFILVDDLSCSGTFPQCFCLANRSVVWPDGRRCVLMHWSGSAWSIHGHAHILASRALLAVAGSIQGQHDYQEICGTRSCALHAMRCR